MSFSVWDRLRRVGAGGLLYLVLGVGGLSAATTAYFQWRGRVQAEALAAAAQERAQEALAARDSAQARAAARDSAVAELEEQLAQERARREALNDSLEVMTQEASARVVQAGDSLAATLDSIQVVLPETHRPLARTAHRQLRQLERGHQDVARALRDQLRNTQAILATADSSRALLRSQLEARDEVIRQDSLAIQELQEEVRQLRRAQGGLGLGKPLLVGGGAAAALLLALVLVQ